MPMETAMFAETLEDVQHSTTLIPKSQRYVFIFFSNTFYKLIGSQIQATCSAHRDRLILTILIKLGVLYKSRSTLVYNKEYSI
jgi:hypothetical protein